METGRTLGFAAAVWSSAALAAAIAGCSYQTNIASGGACQRTVQCAPGLVCSQGHCTNDLTMFGMGHPTVLDGGVVDGAAADTGVVMYDTNVPPVDMGPPIDTGVPPVDAWSPPVDAWSPPQPDAWTPPQPDAWTPPADDAWTAPMDDAWVDPNDAG